MREVKEGNNTYRIEISNRYPGRHVYRVDLIQGEWPADPKALGRMCDNRYDYFGGSQQTPTSDQTSVFVTCYVD